MTVNSFIIVFILTSLIFAAVSNVFERQRIMLFFGGATLFANSLILIFSRRDSVLGRSDQTALLSMSNQPFDELVVESFVLRLDLIVVYIVAFLLLFALALPRFFRTSEAAESKARS